MDTSQVYFGEEEKSNKSDSFPKEGGGGEP